MEQVTPGPRQERHRASTPETAGPPRFAPLPPPAMIRSRAAASRAPAAPLRGRFAPPDPAARSQEPAAIRAREHSEARPQTVNAAHRGTTCVTAAMQVSGQRPGRRSGPWNRLLCRSAPVLSRYAGARTARLTGACRASRTAGSPPFCSRWTAGWSCSYPRLGQAAASARAIPSRAATEAVTGCAPPAAGWKTGTAPWQATLRADLGAARAAASCRKGSRYPLSGTGSG